MNHGARAGVYTITVRTQVNETVSTSGIRQNERDEYVQPTEIHSSSTV